MENISEPIIMYSKPVIESLFKNFQLYPNTTLTIFTNSKDEASNIYVKNKKLKCEEYGIKCVVKDISECTYEKVVDYIAYSIMEKDYIILQKPLPEHLKKYESKLDSFISKHSELDLDAFNGDLTTDFNTPATPLGIMKMLDYYIGLKNLEGKNAVVIGRSKIVGKPMAKLLDKYNCTVTVCHSKTKDISYYTKNADLIVIAIGKSKFLTIDMVGENKPIIIDVGINRDENGKVYGDVDFENVKDKCSFISPVPKGVGPLTVSSLIYKMGEINNGK